MNCTKLTFTTEAELRGYIASRSVWQKGPYGEQLNTPAGTDDLFFHVGYAYARQGSGAWLLVF